MDTATLRKHIKENLIAAAQRDVRIAAVADYGTSGQGRGDLYSDLDVCLFIRDEHLDDFKRDWKEWAAQFGRLLLAYTSWVGHPWAVFDAGPLPLRVDFAFEPLSAVEQVKTWPCSPPSVEAMVWYDDTGGELSRLVGEILNQPLGPLDLQQTFEQACGDLWYYLLRTWGKVQRGHLLAAWYDHHFAITGALMSLLRIEAGAVERWRGSIPAIAIEQALSAERLAALRACGARPERGSLLQAMRSAASLGFEVCQNIAQIHAWAWPRPMGERLISLLEQPNNSSSTG